MKFTETNSKCKKCENPLSVVQYDFNGYIVCIRCPYKIDIKHLLKLNNAQEVVQ